MNESLKKKIELRAYQLFLKRGGAHGYHVQDWARAEKEILAEESGAKPVNASKPPAPAPKPAQPKKSQAPGRK
jgi:hypothetical protein